MFHVKGEVTYLIGFNNPGYDGFDNAVGGTVYFDGLPLTQQSVSVPFSTSQYADIGFYGPSPPGMEFILAYSQIQNSPPYLLPSNFTDFTLNGTKAVSGEVSCVSRCDVSATPLPAALPLFGTALAGLGGVGYIRRRGGKVSA